jgi:hypothetical protein
MQQTKIKFNQKLLMEPSNIKFNWNRAECVIHHSPLYFSEAYIGSLNIISKLLLASMPLKFDTGPTLLCTKIELSDL